MRVHEESNPSSLAPPDGHFSQCTLVQAGTRLLFISGQVARDAEGKTVGVGNMSRQAEQVFENLKTALSAHGADFQNIVKATLYITRMDLADEVVAVRERYYGVNKPASTFVGVTALNEPDWWLEVELIAALTPTSAA